MQFSGLNDSKTKCFQNHLPMQRNLIITVSFNKKNYEKYYRCITWNNRDILDNIYITIDDRDILDNIYITIDDKDILDNIYI